MPSVSALAAAQPHLQSGGVLPDLVGSERWMAGAAWEGDWGTKSRRDNKLSKFVDASGRNVTLGRALSPQVPAPGAEVIKTVMLPFKLSLDLGHTWGFVGALLFPP